MSYDTSSQLRDSLHQIDLSGPAVQGAAGAMMKHYDKSPGVAVVEWRNALHHAQSEQYLPLFYVANEVLQNSKRNRGNKFLEAFSPILGQSIIFVCDKSSPSIVESIRRTIKIWAERHVFSIRYINELIKKLQPYRNGGNNNNAKKTVNKRSSNDDDGISSPGGSRFSPVTQPETNSTKQKSSSSLVSPSQNKNDTKRRENFDRDMSMNDNGDDLFGDNNSSNHDDDDDDNNNNDGDGEDDDDDDVDLFGNASKKLLKIDVDLDRASTATKSTSGHSKKKRRRSSNELATDGGIAVIASKSRRRSLTLLSTNSLMELWNQVSSLQTSYERACGKINEINSVNDNTGHGGSGDDSTKNRGIDTLIGDELLEEYKKVLGYEHQIEYQRRELHSIAQKRRSLELEAVRYLPWLERALQHDQEDIDFCDKYRKQLDLYRHVYEPSKLARDHRLREERHRQEEEEKLRRKKEEEEEQKKFMRSAMAKQTEAQPGMVWNRATGEYQHLNHDESWRD